MKVESFKCASRDTLENHLMWVQTLMRTYPDNFKKSMYFSVKAIKPPTFKVTKFN